MIFKRHLYKIKLMSLLINKYYNINLNIFFYTIQYNNLYIFYILLGIRIINIRYNN